MLLLCAAFCLGLFAACDSGGGGKYGNIASNGKPTLADPDFQRTPPPVVLTNYSGEDIFVEADEGEGIRCELNYSNAADGYIGTKVTAPSERKSYLDISIDGTFVYRYSLRVDGEPEFFPLAQGSGRYQFLLYVEAAELGNNFATYIDETLTLNVADEFRPFLINNKLVNYTERSQAVQFSYELTQNCSTDLEVAQVIYRWICDNIVYDEELAANSSELTHDNYVPDVDRILARKMGICYDYAALAAAMLRANGIPTRLVMGNASTNTGVVYHAWNELYLEEEGWIAVKIQVDAFGFTRIDATFAAGSDNALIGEFIGDGSHYMEMSYH